MNKHKQEMKANKFADNNYYANRAMENETSDANALSIMNAILALALEAAQINEKLEDMLANGLPIETVSD